MNGDILDVLDIFRQEYRFSNRVSTTTGKLATVLYILFFMYLSVVALLNVMSRQTKNVFVQQVYDLNFATNNDYYKKLHVIATIEVYRTNNAQVNNPKEVLRNYLNMQISYISSTCYDYKTDNLYDYEVYENGNMVTYFITYDIKTLNDFFKISMEKLPLITTREIDQFFRDYTIKIHIDYYFLKTEEMMFIQHDDFINFVRGQNQVFEEYGYFDYISQTKSQDYLVVNFNNYRTSGNNIMYYFNPYILNLDTGVMLTESHQFQGFLESERNKNDFATSIMSFEFRLTPKINKFFFSYKKIASAFGEIAGIMNFLRFIIYVYVIVITFIKRNQFFTDQLFDREIIVKNYDKKGRAFSRRLYAPHLNASSSRRFEGTVKDMSDISPVRSAGYMMPRESNNFVQPVDDKQDFRRSSFLGIKKSNSIFILTLAIKEVHQLFKINERLHIEEIKSKNVIENDDVYLFHDKKARVNSTLDKIDMRFKRKKYSCLNFIVKTFCTWCYREKHSSLKRLILYKFYQKNMDKMDIILVQKKLTLIDIISYLLLEPRHIALLNYVKKEQISLDYATGESKFENKYAKTYSKEEIVDFITSIKDTPDTDPRDRKLLEILEPEIVKIIGKK